MLEFHRNTPFVTIAMAQGGDYVGGEESTKFGVDGKKPLMRKAMNSFICSVDRPFKFIGRINEDVNTYTLLGSRGVLFGTIMHVMLNQVQTQQSKGGMSSVYVDSGTYIKSFYSVIVSPSAVKVSLMGDVHKRLHHRVDWRHAVPKIMKEQ